MAVFEIQGPDGQTYEVDAPDMQSAVSAIQSLAAPQVKPVQADMKNPDGTYGQPPADMFANPTTGQMTSRELLRGNVNTDRGDAILGGVGQGILFGLGDEIAGGVGRLEGGAEMGNFRKEQARANMEANREAHPGAFLAGEIGGAALPAIASAPLAVGRGLLGTIGRSALIGAGEGAAHGAGRGEGVKDRFGGAVREGILGALIGGALPAVVSGGKAAYRAFADPVGGALNVGNAGRANRAIANTVEKSGRSVDDVADDVLRAAREGQPEYRTMDALGVTGQRRAGGLTRAGGPSGDELAEYLTQRQLDQGDRVASFVDDAFDMGGNSARQTRDTLTAGRNATANTAYEAARGNAAPVDVRGAVSVIDGRIGGMQGVDIAGDSIDAKLAQFRSRLAANKTPEGVDSIELSDFDRVLGVKQDVQDAIGAAVRAGRNNEARELGKLSSALDEALEESSGMYRAANDGYRESSRVIEAVDRGADMAKRGRRATDTVGEFTSMTPDQQAAARVGYGDRALAQIEANAAPTANKARPFQSTKARAEADAMASDPALFSDRMGRETQMWETQNRALGGSRTADNLADMDATGRVAADAGGVLRSVANFQIGDAVANAGRMIAPHLSGQNEATRRMMMQALMSQDPRQALQPAMKSRGAEVLRQRMIEALLRNMGREGYPN